MLFLGRREKRRRRIRWPEAAFVNLLHKKETPVVCLMMRDAEEEKEKGGVITTLFLRLSPHQKRGSVRLTNTGFLVGITWKGLAAFCPILFSGREGKEKKKRRNGACPMR